MQPVPLTEANSLLFKHPPFPKNYIPMETSSFVCQAHGGQLSEKGYSEIIATCNGEYVKIFVKKKLPCPGCLLVMKTVHKECTSMTTLCENCLPKIREKTFTVIRGDRSS